MNIEFRSIINHSLEHLNWDSFWKEMQSGNSIVHKKATPER